MWKCSNGINRIKRASEHLLCAHTSRASFNLLLKSIFNVAGLMTDWEIQQHKIKRKYFFSSLITITTLENWASCAHRLRIFTYKKLKPRVIHICICAMRDKNSKWKIGTDSVRLDSVLITGRFYIGCSNALYCK